MNQRRLRAASLVFLFLLGSVWALAACQPVHIKTRQGVYHKVERHETLWGICRAYDVSMESVCRFNRIEDPDHVATGRKIFIPGADAVQRVIVKRMPAANDTEIPRPGSAGSNAEGKRLASTPNTPVTAPRPPRRMSRTAAPDFIWPLRGKLASRFGIRNGRRHDGIDIAVPKGTAIHAAARGKVIYSDNGIKGYGNLIIIKHSGGFSTVYAHNQRNRVRVDDSVEKGWVIGYVGRTGRSSGYHLHFEIRKGIKAEDPMRYLP